MTKQREYKYVRPEIYRSCKGEGIVKIQPSFHPYGKEVYADPVLCDICQGSGKVRKTVEIKVSIEAFAQLT